MKGDGGHDMPTQKVILIVEDDPMSLELFRDVLQVSGYATLEATDGKRGVELAQEKKPDLILMDIQLPVMDGLEATSILKADSATKNIPIIALTAYAMEEDEERVIQAGADGYLTKPIRIQGFLAKVEEHLK
jgi:two-component system cell cycle response regulator DivK